MHPHIHAHIHTHMHARPQIHVTHACMCEPLHTYMHPHIQVYIHTHARINPHIHACTPPYICTHIHTHTKEEVVVYSVKPALPNTEFQDVYDYVVRPYRKKRREEAGGGGLPLSPVLGRQPGLQSELQDSRAM